MNINNDKTINDPDVDLTEDEVRSFIAAHVWTVAKTMPHNPHAYTVRSKARDDLEFVRFVLHIRKNGYKMLFGRTTYTCLNVDGMRYWTMGCPLWDTRLINRATNP